MGLADIFRQLSQVGKAPAERDYRTLRFEDILREDAPDRTPAAPRPPSPGRGDGGLRPVRPPRGRRPGAPTAARPARRPPRGMAPPPAPTPSYARLPEQYDVDDAFTARLFPGYKRKGIPTPMFGNIKHENCVIAGRAHQTLRSRLAERKCLIKVTNQDVMNEFKKETGGKDQPISVLHSLKRWRCVGWKVAGETRKIKFFARLNKRDHEKIKRAISIDIGVGLGLMLPDSAITQFFDEYGKPKPLSQREPWEVSPNGGEESLKHIGHYVYVTGYTKRGPVCVTWGRKQQMSWAFVNKYCDEAYAIIDAINTPEKKRFLDEKKIKRFLEMCDEHEEGS